MKRNIAERAGSWSASHWKTATGGWLALVAIAVVLGNAAGTVKLTGAEQTTGGNARAAALLSNAGFHQTASEAVLVQSRVFAVRDPAFRRTLARGVAAVGHMPEVRNVRSPLNGHAGQISRDGHSALVQFDLRGPADTAHMRVKPVLDRVAALQKAAPRGFIVAEFGDASSGYAMSSTINRDFSRAERMTVPVTFLVLLVAFGAFVAAAVPVLLAFSAVLGSLGLFAVVSHLLHASDAASSVMLLMGMAVGVDYSLFYLKREREERRNTGPKEALARAASTSGKAVLISGATVLIAMAGMLFAGSKVFTSIGVGAMLVVFTTMVGSITVLPALLGRLGDSVERGFLAVLAAIALRLLRPLGQPRPLVWLRDRRTLIQRVKGERETSRLWSIVLRPALRFPAIAAAIATALLLLAATPVLGIRTKLLSFTDLPKSVKIVATYEKIQRAFPGAQTPAVVVIRARNLTSASVRSEIAALERAALTSGRMSGPIDVSVNGRHTVAQVAIPLAGIGDDGASMAALGVLRGKVLPATLGRDPSLSYAVTGQTAGSYDFNQAIKQHWPVVFAFVLGLAFLLLLVSFRSIVIPLTAIALNLLSVGAAYGCSSGCSRTVTCKGCWDSSQTAPWSRGSRCSCSRSYLGSRWTITCSSSVGSRNSWTGESPPSRRCRRASPVQPAPSLRRRL